MRSTTRAGRRRAWGRTRLAGLAAGLGLALALPATAQTRAPAGGGFQLPAVPPSSAWPGTGPSDSFTVQRWLFEGHSPLSTAELEALAAPFTGRPIRGVELEELRQRITRAHVDRGWVSSGAVIPDNAYRDGSLRLRIVEGRVSQLRLNGMQGLSDDYVAARLIQTGDVLNVNDLQERFQLLLADPLFDRLNARLMPGATLGSSVIDIDVTRARSVQAWAFANNHGAPAVGSTSGGIELTLRNLSGWGDALGASLSKSGGSNNTDLSWQLPLGARSTTLTLRFAQGRSSVTEEPLDALDIGSTVRTREATLAHPVINQPRRRLSLGLGHVERRNSTSIGDQPFSFIAGEPSGTTQVRAWRLFQDLSLRLDRHVLALRSTFVSGTSNLPAQADPALPTQPARSYRLWVGQAQASIAVGDQGAQVLLRGSLQRAADRLVPLEQFSVGGRHTVRGYRENQLVRDNGYALSTEFHYPLLREESPRRSLTLVPFADLGAAHNRGEARSKLAAVGLGLQWAWADLEGDLYLARRLESRPTDTHGDLQDRGIHLSLRYRLY